MSVQSKAGHPAGEAEGSGAPSGAGRRVDIAGLGECMVELSAQGADLEQATTFERYFGGDTLNVAAVAAAVGASVAYITAVGTDPFGRYLRRAMESLAIDTSAVISRSEAPTGVYFVEPGPTGDRRFHYYRAGSAASAFGPDDLDEALLGQVRVLHVSGISQALSSSMRAATLRAADVVRRQSGAISYDPNFRSSLWESPAHAREALEELMPIDFLCPSVADLEALYPGERPEEFGRRFRALGARSVFVKAGAAGSYLASEEGEQWIGVEAVESPTDTTGAGDFAVGVFLAHLVRGSSAVSAAGAANRFAAKTTEHHGSINSLLSSGAL